jgi:hypothetical protein
MPFQFKCIGTLRSVETKTHSGPGWRTLRDFSDFRDFYFHFREKLGRFFF